MSDFDPTAPFATVDDLEAAWRVLSDAERARAKKLIEYATARIRAMLPTGWESMTDVVANLEAVTVAAVQRQMAPGVGSLPVSQISQAAGGYTASATFEGAAGAFYLRQDEKDALRIGGCVVASVGMEAGWTSPD
jgi:hypothetical protein